MIIEIINVGTELLLGEITNTNATYLQILCKDLGFHVYHQTVVGDNPDRFKACLDTAFNRGADCVITTGGLGPTADDLTKELSAQYFGLELVFNEVEAKKVKDKCSFLTGLDNIPENNFKQAWFPENCYILENDVGTANACVMHKDGKKIINLPGPPKELQYVVEHSLKPYLFPFKKERIYTYDYITMGIGESRIAEMLKDVINQQKTVTIALYASEDSVRIRLGCAALSKEDAKSKMHSTKTCIEQIIHPYWLKHTSIKEALYEIMPAYYFEYHSTLTMRNDFVLGKEVSNDKDAMKIEIDTIPHHLGEIVEVTLKYQSKEYTCHIPLLKKAELSMLKLESKIRQNIYKFLKEINKKAPNT